MSFEAQAWARTIRTGSPTKKAVLMDIANNYNNVEGCAWASQKRIAYNTELSERAVRNALADLEDEKVISRKSRKNTTDLIYLSMPDPDGGKFPMPTRGPGGPNANDNQRHQMPVGRTDQRQELPVVAAGDAGVQRQDVPVVEAPGAGGYRNDVPVVAAGDAGGYRQEVPLNLYVEPLEEPLEEPLLKKKKKRGPAAPFPVDAFDQFWKLYPRTDGKALARRIFTKIADEGFVEFADIMAGLQAYVDKKTEPKFTLHAATFLNQERWEDDKPKPPTPEDTAARLKANRKWAI